MFIIRYGNLVMDEAAKLRIAELGFESESFSRDIADHKSSLRGEPSVYCGTYAKYGDGDLSGLWLDIDSFDDYDEFISFCKALHADEQDPELMFQDYDSIPRDLACGECISKDDFDNIKQYADLCDRYSKEAVDAFIGWGSEKLEDFEDCYVGEYDSEEDFAREFVNENYDLERLMGHLADYFDYKAFAYDLFLWDYYIDEPYVFRHP